MSDDEILDAFLECRLSRADFHHRAHLRVAWLLVNRYPLPTAIELACEGIERFAAYCGARDKYHRTVSESLMRLIAAAQARAAHAELAQFMDANPALVGDVRGVLAQYYSPERLASSDAKRRFVPPDLQALP